MNSRHHIIEGKPYIANYYGRFFVLNNGKVDFENFQSDPLICECKKILTEYYKEISKNNDLYMLNEQIIIRPPYDITSIFQNGTIAIKCELFGRAYKVMRIGALGVRRTKKMWICGRRVRK